MSKALSMRNALAIAAGLAIGVVTVAITEGLGHALFPPPEGLNLKDPGVLAQIIEKIPLGAKIAVLAAWGLGIFFGAVGALYVSQGLEWTGWAVALVMALFAAYTLVIIPHPSWMIAGAVLVTLAGSFGAQKAIGYLRI